ncbi:hypothetical protein Vadar_029084 [Vaccinium darrowii]|uniref:Uncharacterized protein n=1 Tax=Vaccinium darrowii TaxID=229202 RepID=A0ACB7Y2P7_9ERIC|nr:hypothetical protein Vadar_029084 [Vaccinium darrowii]
MASIAMHSSTLIIFSIFLITLHFPSPSLAYYSYYPSTPPSSQEVCNSTLFPSFCTSIFPTNNNFSSVCDYGRYSICRSLDTTRNLLSLVDSYLPNSYALSETDIRALGDCNSLINLNIDFLSIAIQNVDPTDTLPNSQAVDMHTLLSAVLTNHQTCWDGVQSSTTSDIQNALVGPFSDENMQYSVSLALFKQGWVSDATNGRWLQERNPLFNRKAHSRLKIPSREKKIYEPAGVRGRKLLQSGEYVNVNQMVVVRQDGTGDFTTIGDAVAAAPNDTAPGGGYFVIYVVAGVYQEYVSIGKSQTNLMMIGDGIGQTIITGSRSAVDGWTTFNSATFAVVGQGFVAVNITFQNTAGAAKYQAVELRNGADLSALYSCSFEGYQDTLYTHSLRQFYKDCDIYGTVDFIFGNAAVVFQSCNIYPRLPMDGQYNTITAQGRTDVNQNTGISIQGCRVTAAPDLAPSTGTVLTFLGRPWKEYSRTIYMQSFMDSLVDPAGWVAWSGDFALNTLYYAEYDNYGPGSQTTFRVTWPSFNVISAVDAVNFTVSNFVSGDMWMPSTGVPYSGGLM